MAQDRIANVAGHTQHFGAGTDLCQDLPKFMAAHPRHNHIGDDQMDGAFELLALPQSLGTIRGCDHMVPVECEEPHDEVADHFLILGYQYRLGAAHDRRRLFRHDSRACFVDPWEVDLKRRTFPRFAIAPNVPIALLDNSVDGSQTQPCAIPPLLGREEGLEYPGLGWMVHATAIVTHGKHHISPGGDRYMGSRIILIKIDVLRLEDELAPQRHRISCIDDEVHHDLLDLSRVSLDSA